MDTTAIPFEFNLTFEQVPMLKSLPKGIQIRPEADDIVQDDILILDTDPSNENPSSSIYMMIFIPIASIALIIALASAVRWRYRINHTLPINGKGSPHVDNNNDSSKAEEERKAIEESVPLKSRNLSTSSSTSTISRNILIEGSQPVTVSMRIVSETQNKEKLKSNRTESYHEINPAAKDLGKSVQEDKENLRDSVTLEREVLKENKTENVTTGNKEEEAKIESLKTVKFTEETKPKENFPKRPRTLQVMTILDSNKAINTNCSKGFPWSEQQWTPDADVIYEDIGSPENRCELQKETEDCLFPLMAKGRFKMKPKGLLERRGSNVALTISLKNEEKTCASPPPSSKSPKPLVYLRTASTKLDPVQLHIKASDTARLQQEFWDVPMNHPSEKHFSIPGYGTKNRYRSILPNPHSRVLLPATPGGDPLSSYINANYVRGYSAMSEAERRRQSEDGKENDARRMSMKRKAGFIATQGPMANTICDFWKMVWRENSTAIVMITKLKERKEKCSEYMPSIVGETRTYEQFEIEIKNVRYADHYTVRTVEVRNLEEEGEVHTLSHYWYSEWLDHETPDKLRGLLTLVQEVDLKCPDSVNADHGPVVVHCSAGIGRTGCFIAINIGCRQLRVEGKVDPLRIICQLRMDRGGMIQTWEQYQYVHVALSRYARILAGENVNTPLTGSSIRSPDSRNSSKHTTPDSAGVNNDLRSPQNSMKLFSPKVSTKPDLFTVDENANGDDNNQTVEREDIARSIFSPRQTETHQRSRFSFSCADGNKGEKTQDSQNPSNGVSPPQDNDPLTSKRTKKNLPPSLALKINPKPIPIRDENWLVNGHCVVPDENGIDDDPPAPQGQGLNEVAENGNHGDQGAGCDLDSKDYGKLRNILSPTGKDCQSQSEEKKLSIFMFPSPDK